MAQDKIEITVELKDLISGQFQKINDQVNKLENSLKSIDNVGSKSGKGGFWNMDMNLMAGVTAGNLLSNAISNAGSAVLEFGKESVEAYQRTEGYEARLTTLLGSRKAAEIDLINLRKDAAKTPFDLQSLIQGNSMLIGSGESAEGARKAILDLGNAIAATGGGSDELSRMSVNLAQIKSIGKASALDVKQFMYANIPIYDMLAKSMKKPISEIKKMDISYQDLTKALADARKEGGMFANGLENASNTLSGLRSNLDDTIETLKSNIGETFADTLKESIRGLLPVMDELNAKMIEANGTSKVLNREGLGFRFFESLATKGEMGSIKTALDKAVSFASGGEAQAKGSEMGIKRMLADITRNYRNEKEIFDLTGEGNAPDSEKYLREVALIKDALSSIKDLKNAGKKAGQDAGGGELKQASDLEKVAKANRPTQVNINIENLVREYTNEFNTAAEALKMTPETVARVLIGAVNDISTLKFGS